MAFYEQKPDGTVQTFQGDVPQEAIQIMDSMDEAQIIANMTTGTGTDVLFYRFPIRQGDGSSKEVIGISVEGGYEIASGIRNLEVLNDYKVDKESDPDYIYVGLRVRNLATNNTLLGMGRACKFVVGKGFKPDRERLDDTAFVKAVSKAQRNGILHHADQRMLAKLIEEWSKGGKGKLLQAPQVRTDNQKPAVVQPVQRAAAPASAPTPAPTPATPPPATSIPTPAPAITSDPGTAAAISDAIKDAEARIKKLRVEIHNLFQNDLGINQEKRKEVITEMFKACNPVPNSLTDLTENQLNQLKEYGKQKLSEKGGGTKTTASPQAQPTPTPASAPTQSTDPAVALGFTDVTEQNRMRQDLLKRLSDPDMLGLSTDESKKFVSDRGFAKSVDIPKANMLKMFDEIQEAVELKKKAADF